MKIIISIIGLMIASAILINGNLFFKNVSALILNDLISTENVYNDEGRLTLESLFENRYGNYGSEKEKLAEKDKYQSNDTPDIKSLSDEDDYFLSNSNYDKEKEQLTNDDKIVIPTSTKWDVGLSVITLIFVVGSIVGLFFAFGDITDPSQLSPFMKIVLMHY